MDDLINSFPTNGLLPKKETTALSFLTKNPNYDGRGVIIAILDTGVDPAANGLQTTTDNKPKILDLIDATGAGNVDISAVKQADSEGFLLGLTGRKLKIPKAWSNPSGKYNVGMKALFDLCSVALKDRLLKERKEKLWQANHENQLAQVQKRLSDFNAKKTATKSAEFSVSSSTTNEDGADKEKSNNTNNNEFINSLIKEDLQAQLDLIKDLENKIKDSGPIFDCLVWNDGRCWRACIDTTEKGDLEKCKVLTNYKDSYEYGTFSYLDMLNYSVRILNDENILQIVTDSSSHGTHVASIAAGYYADKPDLNGIAPGAQIISIKIGDNRINGMETSFALVNACRYVIENKCDLVNYSFGEPINYSNNGPALQAVQDLIDKHGVIFCASAGNEGPGIETCGAPGGCGTTTISVAAYLSNDMIKAEHSLIGNGSPMLFTWSSRGPQLDGHLGISVCAPGGAFASVPNWCQRGSQLMSGTSMSSPNCCGCLALILSGLKQNNIEFNPFGVKRAIENTALKVDETIGSGAGLIQVEKAFNYLVEYSNNIIQNIHFDVKYTNKNKQMRGIYLKSNDELNDTRDYLVTIEPIFFENKLNMDKHDEDLLHVQKEKISLNKKLLFVCDDNEDYENKNWLEHPAHLYIVNSQRQFFIRIKANLLESGRSYFTQIKAFDVDDPKMGPLFKIPINIVKPFTSKIDMEFNNVFFKQGKIYRHFIRAPFGATHAELSFKCLDSVNDHTPFFYVQSFTLDSFRSPTECAKEEAFRLNTTNEFKYLFKVNSNRITQISIAKNWSNIGQLNVNYSIKLRGLSPRNLNEMSVFSTHPYKLEIGSYLRNEDCDPSIQYKHYVQSIKPSDNQIELIKSKIYQITLTYNFHQVKQDEICCEVPLLSHHLYENEYQSIFWMIFESTTKRFLLAGDAFPFHYKYSRSLDKGDYIIRLHVRHEKMDMLEKIKDISINVRHSLSSAINQEIFTSYAGLLKGTGKKTSVERITKNTETIYYLNPIADDKLPKGLTNGNYLVGELTLFKDSSISKVDSHRVFYQLNNCSSSQTNNSSSKKQAEKQQSKMSSAKSLSSDSASSDSLSLNNVSSSSTIAKKTDDDKLNEAIRDLKVAHILKSNDIFDSLRSEYEDHIPLYINRIQYLDQKVTALSDLEKKNSIYDEIIDLSKTALDKIDQNGLLRYFGEKQHDPSTEENKKDFDNQKSWVIELLAQQGQALIEKITSSSKINEDVCWDNIDELKLIYRSLQKWIDINDDKVSKFTHKFYNHYKLNGKLLKVLFKQLDDKPSNQQATDQAILNALKQMKSTHASDFYENHLILKYVKQYAIY